MFTVRDTKFRQALQRMQGDFGGNLRFVITVPPEMSWWMWQEFGTAYYAEKPGSNSPSGYRIPKDGFGYLKFWDRSTGDYKVTAYAFTLGIPSHHMVTDVLPEIQVKMKTSVVQALKENGYSFSKLHDSLLAAMMPEIKEIIRQSFATKLDLSIRPGGKIPGSAEAEFAQKATIKDIST